MLSPMTKLSFPEDIEINSDSLICGGEKINFDEKNFKIKQIYKIK